MANEEQLSRGERAGEGEEEGGERDEGVTEGGDCSFRGAQEG